MENYKSVAVINHNPKELEKAFDYEVYIYMNKLEDIKKNMKSFDKTIEKLLKEDIDSKLSLKNVVIVLAEEEILKDIFQSYYKESQLYLMAPNYEYAMVFDQK